MTTMKERMARAMCREESLDPHHRAYSFDIDMWEIWLPAAEVALDAMMEPDALVVEAGSALVGAPPITTSQADACFRAMITAIKEGGE